MIMPKLYRIVRAYIFLTLLLPISILGCEKHTEETVSTLSKIKSEGVVRVGYANEAPYAYYDSEVGRFDFQCPDCGGVIIPAGGQELYIKEVEIE